MIHALVAWIAEVRVEQRRDAVVTPLANDLGYLLWRAGKLSIKAAQSSLAELGVRPRHYAVLGYCAERGPFPQRAISDALGLDPSATVAVLDDLERAGYVARHLDARDRRVRLIAVTEQGQAFLARCQRGVDVATARLVSELAEPERLQLQALLRRVVLANEPDAAPMASDGLAANERRGGPSERVHVHRADA